MDRIPSIAEYIKSVQTTHQVESILSGLEGTELLAIAAQLGVPMAPTLMAGEMVEHLVSYKIDRLSVERSI